MILLNTDPADGNTPPAASAIAKSSTEPSEAAELVELRRKLVASDLAKKKVEMDNAQLADELRRLTTPPAPAPPAPPAAPKQKTGGGWTYFDEEPEGAP